MLEFPTVWTENSPDKLLDISVEYCINNPLSTFCKFESLISEYRLWDGISLPEEICERMLNLCKFQANKELCNQFIPVFEDPTKTRLRCVDLSGTKLNDDRFAILARHDIIDLNISDCNKLTKKSLRQIWKLRHCLQALVIGNSTQILQDGDVLENSEEHLSDHRMGLFQPSTRDEYICMFPPKFTLEIPGLKKLIINSLKKAKENIYFNQLLNSAQYLTHLDLSGCQDIGDLSCLIPQKCLVSLILNDVPESNVLECLPAVCQITSLRHLDISISDDIGYIYDNPTKTLRHIVESLPNLVSLDISGTNLAGTRVQERENNLADEFSTSLMKETALTDIPGLESRVNAPLEFLGLLNTEHQACYRHHIPSRKVSGDANEEQILTAGQMYCARKKMIQKVLNDLFHLFRFSTCENTQLGLDIVLEAMRQHLYVKHIQVSGSASLFYIVKGEDKENFNIKIKRRIIKALLDAMLLHSSDVTMLRNGCLTLIHFKIPEDVFFDYERLVSLLLVIVAQDEQDDLVQRISIYLLNSLACQVDELQKQLVGDQGAISIMLQIIESRLHRDICDEVMETAWSTMWNVTDETPVNCARFLEGKGLDLFLGCLKAFPQKPDLLRNMMGLLGNVAEVKELRPSLMKDEYLSVFSDLLSSKSDGIEVSYNAAGILSHIASDGPEWWAEHSISTVTRKGVLKRMVDAIEHWSLDTRRNINYRSFQPILRLLGVSHTPEVQHWAVWALANLTHVYPDKYCSLLRQEGGFDLLHALLRKPGSPRIYQLATTIVQQCRRYDAHEYPKELSRLIF